MELHPEILLAGAPCHELIDCGDGQKLERFGDTLLIRSEPKAWWRKNPQVTEWKEADATFNDKGKWNIRHSLSRKWELSYEGMIFEARLTDMSKHVGIFPEQEPHWKWIAQELSLLESPRVLNLFGYTGAASLVAASAGAEVTHVDASKPSLSWARRNQEISGMNDLPIRWLLDDAFKFVAREIRRNNRYDAILLDPPSFGRGPKGEIWKVEQQIVELLTNLRQLLNLKHGLLIMTLYNLEASSIMLANLVQDIFPSGELSFGELVLPTRAQDKGLPLSLYVRWKSANGH